MRKIENAAITSIQVFNKYSGSKNSVWRFLKKKQRLETSETAEEAIVD